MTFSGGAIDLTLFGILQGNHKTNWIWIVIVGLIYAATFFFSCLAALYIANAAAGRPKIMNGNLPDINLVADIMAFCSARHFQARHTGAELGLRGNMDIRNHGTRSYPVRAAPCFLYAFLADRAWRKRRNLFFLFRHTYGNTHRKQQRKVIENRASRSAHYVENGQKILQMRKVSARPYHEKLLENAY